MNNFWKQLLATIYLLAIAIYISQGILFEGTWLTKFAGFYILVYNLISTYLSIISKGSNRFVHPVISLVSWILLLWFISEKEIAFEGHINSTFTMVQYVVMVMTSLFSFHYISKEGLVSDVFIMLFIVALGGLFVYNIFHYDVILRGAGNYDFSYQNNKVYPLVALFPFFTFFWKRKTIMLLVMTASFILILLCLKRGAILCGIGYMMIVLYYFHKQIVAKHKIKMLYYFVIALLIIALVQGTLLIYNENDIMQMRFEDTMEGYSSSRDLIYVSLLSNWENSDVLLQLFGHGPIASISNIGHFAHNDWLEVLYDFGIIGLFLYIWLIVTVIRIFYRNMMNEQQKAGVMMCLMYLIVRSTFSMCIYSIESILVMGVVGYILGKTQREKK